MTMLWQDGFDHYGDAVQETGAVVRQRMVEGAYAEIDTNVQAQYNNGAILPRTGLGMLVVGGASGPGFNGIRKVLDDNESELFVYFGLYMTSTPEGNNRFEICGLRDASNAEVGAFYIQSNGGIRYDIGGVDATTSANTITAGSWHALCIHVVKSDTVGVIQIWVDGILVLDLSNQNTAAATINMVRFNTASAGSDPATMLIDDWIIHNGGGSYNNSFLGQLKVATVVPRADDPDLAGWTPNTRHKYGNGIFELDGDEDGFTAADNVAFEFGSGDFTAETWVRFRALPTGSNRATLFGKWRAGNNERSYTLYLGGPSLNDSHLQFDISTDGTAGTVVTIASAEWEPVTGKWYHVVVQRDSGETVLFVDGVPLNAPASDANTYHDNASLFCVGGLQNGASTLSDNASVNGYLEEVRVTKGVARYNQTGFAVPTSAFPRSIGAGDADFANVSLLCGFDTALIDESSFGRALTARDDAVRYVPDDAPPGDYKTLSSATPRDDTYMDAALTPASNVLTFTGQPSNADTVEVDSNTYTFNTVLGGAGSVLIGATVSDSIDNLVAAINNDAGEGTLYGTGTTPSDDASALNIDNDQMRVTANTPGTAGNSITADESCANAEWADAGGTLVGGLNLPGPSAFLMTRLPAQTTGVKAVSLVARARKTDTGDGTLQMSLLTADDSSENGDEHPLTTSTAYYHDIIEEDPSTSSALTPSTFVGARVRIDRTA